MRNMENLESRTCNTVCRDGLYSLCCFGTHTPNCSSNRLVAAAVAVAIAVVEIEVVIILILITIKKVSRDILPCSPNLTRIHQVAVENKMAPCLTTGSKSNLDSDPQIRIQYPEEPVWLPGVEEVVFTPPPRGETTRL